MKAETDGKKTALVESATGADGDATRRILHERALALAKVIDDRPPEQTVELVTLDLGKGECAIEAESVLEVVARDEITPLPTAPDFLLGLINVRGRIVAVIDLGNVLDEEVANRDVGQVVIVEVAGVEVGFGVHRCGIVHVPQSALTPSPQDYFKSTTESGVGLIDVAKIIADTRHTAASLVGETKL